MWQFGDWHMSIDETFRNLARNMDGEKNGEKLEPLWTAGDVLPPDLADILEKTDFEVVDADEEPKLPGEVHRGWESDTYDDEFDWDKDSDDFDGIHFLFIY